MGGSAVVRFSMMADVADMLQLQTGGGRDEGPNLVFKAIKVHSEGRGEGGGSSEHGGSFFVALASSSSPAIALQAKLLASSMYPQNWLHLGWWHLDSWQSTSLATRHKLFSGF